MRIYRVWETVGGMENLWRVTLSCQLANSRSTEDQLGWRKYFEAEFRRYYWFTSPLRSTYRVISALFFNFILARICVR